MIDSDLFPIIFFTLHFNVVLYSARLLANYWGCTMNEAHDLRSILAAWPYEPDKNVRVLSISEGREIIQARLPVGIEQYEMDGHPDGQRPHGKGSCLEHFSGKRDTARKQEGPSFQLSEKECVELFAEGVLYYFRYLLLFQIQDWDRTIRDTARNIRLFDFVNTYAERKDDRAYLEPWRPYVLRFNAMAKAMRLIQRDQHDMAAKCLDDCIRRIAGLPEMDNDTFRFERERSLKALKSMAEDLEKNRPVSRVEGLQRELDEAVQDERFEHAAELRDRLRQLANFEDG